MSKDLNVKLYQYVSIYLFSFYQYYLDFSTFYCFLCSFIFTCKHILSKMEFQFTNVIYVFFAVGAGAGVDLCFYSFIIVMLGYKYIGKMRRQNNHIQIHYPITPNHNSNFTPINAPQSSRNSKIRASSIHALHPSRPLTSRNAYKQAPFLSKDKGRQSERIYLTSSYHQPNKNTNGFYSHRQSGNIERNLFMSQEAVLTNLLRETQQLQNEKQRIIKSNREEYEGVVEKLMNMRRLCTQRRHEILALKGQLQALEQKNNYKRVKEFSQTRHYEKMYYIGAGIINERRVGFHPLNNLTKHKLAY